MLDARVWGVSLGDSDIDAVSSDGRPETRTWDAGARCGSSWVAIRTNHLQAGHRRPPWLAAPPVGISLRFMLASALLYLAGLMTDQDPRFAAKPCQPGLAHARDLFLMTPEPTWSASSICWHDAKADPRPEGDKSKEAKGKAKKTREDAKPVKIIACIAATLSARKFPKAMEHLMATLGLRLLYLVTAAHPIPSHPTHLIVSHIS